MDTSLYEFQGLYDETQQELARVVAAKQRELVTFPRSGRSGTTTATKEEPVSGWALLGAAVAVGVGALAIAAADDGEEERRNQRQRRQNRSSFHY